MWSRIRRLEWSYWLVYVTCMAAKLSTTVRLDPADVKALARARRDGFSSSELIRKGLRIVAAKYYRGRRPPSTRLLPVDNVKLGDEQDLFEDLEE